MKVWIKKWKYMDMIGKIAVALVFGDDDDKAIHIEEVTVPGFVLTEQKCRDAFEAAKKKCADPRLRQAIEILPTCEHGVQIFAQLSCADCSFEDPRD
jgi:hypothetical protein